MLEIEKINGNILSYSSIIVSFLLVSLLFSSLFTFFKTFYLNKSINYYKGQIEKLDVKMRAIFKNTSITQGKLDQWESGYVLLNDKIQSDITKLKTKIEDIKDPISPQIYSFLLAIMSSQMSFYHYLIKENFQIMYFISIVFVLLISVSVIWQYKDQYYIYLKDKENEKHKKVIHSVLLLLFLSIYTILMLGLFYIEYKWHRQLFFINILFSYFCTHIFIMLILYYNPSIKDLSKFVKDKCSIHNSIEKNN